MRRGFAFSLLGSLAVACSVSSSEPGSERGPSRDDASPAREGVEGAEGPATEPSFELVAEVPETCLGEAALARITVTPEAPWHLNLDFPTALALEPIPGVEMVGDHQGRGDAQRLDADGLEFSVWVTPRIAGVHEILGEVSFALCGSVECAPKRESILLRVESDPAKAC
jgi:hypothetical protein